jgi:hypothetical protein
MKKKNESGAQNSAETETNQTESPAKLFRFHAVSVLSDFDTTFELHMSDSLRGSLYIMRENATKLIEAGELLCGGNVGAASESEEAGETLLEKEEPGVLRKDRGYYASVINGAQKTLTEATKALLTPPAEDEGGVIKFAPFGPINLPFGIMLARYLIADTFTQWKKAQYYDTGPFDSVLECISHRPGLATERRMLLAMINGCNGLVDLANAIAYMGRWPDRPLTVAETLLGDHMDGSSTLEEVIKMLRRHGFDKLLSEVPQSKALADAIKEMLWADSAFFKIRTWLNADGGGL